MSSVMNGLMVSWAQYTLPLLLPLLSFGVMGNRLIISPTYTLLTMASCENSKLTGALGNVHQKLHPLDFPGFNKETPSITALKTPLTTHLPTPSSLPPPLVPVSLIRTPTPPSTSISSSNITNLEPYIPPKK